MIAKGLIWYHWHFCLDKDCSVKVYSVTKAGEQVFDKLLFKRNVRDRVHGDVGNGTFTYEGVQGVDDPGITGWRFEIYGGLMSCEDTSAAETAGSQIVVITGPKNAFATANESGETEGAVG